MQQKLSYLDFFETVHLVLEHLVLPEPDNGMTLVLLLLAPGLLLIASTAVNKSNKTSTIYHHQSRKHAITLLRVFAQ